MNYKKTLASIFSLLIIFIPMALFSAGLVPDCAENGEYNCDFNVFMGMLNNLIDFVLFKLATPIFALILVYTGWLYLSDMGSTENVKKAKHIFKNAVIGYVIALAAWLIVETIIKSLGYTGETFLIG